MFHRFRLDFKSSFRYRVIGHPDISRLLGHDENQPAGSDGHPHQRRYPDGCERPPGGVKMPNRKRCAFGMLRRHA